MSVPHLIHVFPSFGQGGTEFRVVRIINALGPAFRHSVLPLDGNRDAVSRIDPSIQCDILPRPRGASGVPFWFRLGRALRNAGPNLVLTYNWGAFDAVIAARGGRICPVIHNESGFGPEEAIRLKRRRVVARRLVLNRIYATVVNSRTLLDIALKQYRIDPAKLRFIRNGVDVARFRPRTDDSFRRRLGADGRTLLFGYLGKYRSEKNLPLLLSAFARAKLADAKLALIGDGPCREELVSLAASLGIAGQVIFTGQADDPTPYLQALDVFVMSSLTEQTPNALLEAMSCGLPAIVTDVGDVAELVGYSGPPIVVPSGEVRAYADALATLARDPGLRRQTGAANRQRCLEHYSLDAMVRGFADLYQAALSTR